MKKSIKKVMVKDVIKNNKEYQKDMREYRNINIMDIISQQYPENGEDYALQLWYKTYHNVFAKCTEKSLEDDLETAHLVIDNKHYIVNIRTFKITLI